MVTYRVACATNPYPLYRGQNVPILRYERHVTIVVVRRMRQLNSDRHTFHFSSTVLPSLRSNRTRFCPSPLVDQFFSTSFECGSEQERKGKSRYKTASFCFSLFVHPLRSSIVLSLSLGFTIFLTLISLRSLFSHHSIPPSLSRTWYIFSSLMLSSFYTYVLDSYALLFT